MTTGKRIKECREALGLSVDRVAAALGKNRATVYRYESGYIDDIPISIVFKLAEVLHTTAAYLMGWEEQPAALPAGMLPIATQRVPMLGTIHAGEPTYTDVEYEAYTEAGAAIRCDFALRVVGDSMINARILDGDLVFIRRQDTVADGEIAAVLIDDETTLKRVRFLPGNLLMLQAENPRYQPIIIGGEGETRSVRILGLAVAFQSDVR